MRYSGSKSIIHFTAIDKLQYFIHLDLYFHKVKGSNFLQIKIKPTGYFREMIHTGFYRVNKNL